MTLFDLIAVLILAVSALIGFVRGASREVMTVFAFVVAAVVSIFALRFSGPLARNLIDPDWAANAAAVLVVFVLAYIAARMAGSGLTRRLHNTHALGTADRVTGVGFGLLRGLIMLGVFHLVFHAATPPDRVPQWMSGAALYPLADESANALKKLAPEGSAVANRIAPTLERAVRDGTAPDAGTPQTEIGDDPVETTR